MNLIENSAGKQVAATTSKLATKVTPAATTLAATPATSHGRAELAAEVGKTFRQPKTAPARPNRVECTKP